MSHFAIFANKRTQSLFNQNIIITCYDPYRITTNSYRITYLIIINSYRISYRKIINSFELSNPHKRRNLQKFMNFMESTKLKLICEFNILREK